MLDKDMFESILTYLKQDDCNLARIRVLCRDVLEKFKEAQPSGTDPSASEIDTARLTASSAWDKARTHGLETSSGSSVLLLLVSASKSVSQASGWAEVSWETLHTIDEVTAQHQSLDGQVCFNRLSMCQVLAKEWMSCGELEKAEVVLSQAGSYLEPAKVAITQVFTKADTATAEDSVAARLASSQHEGNICTLFDHLLLRAVVLWRLGQCPMALQLSKDISSLLTQLAEATHGTWAALYPLYIEFVEVLLILAVQSLPGGNADASPDSSGGVQWQEPRIGNLLSHAALPAAVPGPVPNGISALHGTMRYVVTDQAHVQEDEQLVSGRVALLEMALQAVADVGMTLDAAMQADADRGSRTFSPAFNAFTSAGLISLRVRCCMWLAYCHWLAGNAKTAQPCLAAMQTSWTQIAPEILHMIRSADQSMHDMQNEGGPRAQANDRIYLKKAEAAMHALQSLVDSTDVACLKIRITMLAGNAQDSVEALAALAASTDASPGMIMTEVQVLAGTKSPSIVRSEAGHSSTGQHAQQVVVTCRDMLHIMDMLLKKCGTPDQCAAYTARYLLLAAAQCEGSASQTKLPGNAPVATPDDLEEIMLALLVPRGDQGPDSHARHLSQLAEIVKEGRNKDAQQGRELLDIFSQLLINRGFSHWKAKELPRAVTLLEAAQVYNMDANRIVEVAKVLALACLACKQYDRALQQLQAAEQAYLHIQTTTPADQGVRSVARDQAALPVVIPFLLIKLHLERGDVTLALEQLQRMASCEGYQPQLLEVVCAEACRSGCFTVACDALTALHANIVAQAETRSGASEQNNFDQGGDAPGLDDNAGRMQTTLVEADVLRTHLNCLEAQFRSSGKSEARNSRDSEALTKEQYLKLAALAQTVSKRLTAVGYDAFFGAGGSAQVAQANLEYIASAATRLAGEAGSSGYVEAAAVFYVSVVNILGHVPSLSHALVRLRRTTAVMAAVCAMTVSREVPSKRAHSLQLARKMLETGRELYEAALATKPGDSPDGRTPSTVHDSDLAGSEAALTYYELMCIMYLRDFPLLSSLLQEVLPSMAQGELPTADQWCELATLCSSEGGEPALVRQLYDQALHKLAAQQPSRPQLTAQVLHALIELSDSDAQTLSTYKEAAQLMAAITAAIRENDLEVNKRQRITGPGSPTTPPDARQINTDVCVHDSGLGGAMEVDEDNWAGAGGLQHRSGRGQISYGAGSGSDHGEIFPGAEVEWMVATCWNKGAQHARFQRFQEGRQFLQVALDLVRFAPATYQQAHQELMKTQLKKAMQEDA